MRGIDVSPYQHPAGASIDWQAVAASGIAAVMVKLTEGSTWLNPYAAGDCAAAAAAGLQVGCYHFARPDLGNGADAEAAWFAVHLADLALDLPPALDSERPAPGLRAWNEAWLERVPEAVGYGLELDLPLDRLWVIRGGPEPADPGGAWGVQYGQGPVRGIAAICDLDVFRDPEEDPDMIVVNTYDAKTGAATGAYVLVPQTGGTAPFDPAKDSAPASAQRWTLSGDAYNAIVSAGRRPVPPASD